MVQILNGDDVLCFEGGLATIERMGGAVNDLLQCCNGNTGASFSSSKDIDW